MNVTLGMPFLRVMVKRSREKSNGKKQRSSNTLLWEKTAYLKFTTNGIRKYHQKLSSKLDSDVMTLRIYPSEIFHCVRIPCDATVKLAGLLLTEEKRLVKNLCNWWRYETIFRRVKYFCCLIRKWKSTTFLIQFFIKKSNFPCEQIY